MDGRKTTDSQTSPLGAIKNVYLDYDETITEGLSAHSQIRAVIEGVSKRMESPEEAMKFIQERKATVAKLTNDYGEAVRENLRYVLSQFPKGEFNIDSINAALDICAEFDQKWSQISVDAQILQGVRRDDFLKAATTTPMKTLSLETIKALRDSGMNITITSVNWSADWIQLTLGEDSCVVTDKNTDAPDGCIRIFSNEVIYEDETATGEVTKLMESGRDKARILRRLLREEKEQNGAPERSVFITDSYNDIQCLLMVDVGILIGDSVAFKIFADHFGIQLLPLTQMTVDQPLSIEGAPIVYTTDSWMEIAAVILGKDRATQLLTASIV